MIESGSTIAASHIFNILMHILSWPWILSKFNDLIMFIISLFSNLNKESYYYCYYLKVYIETQKIIEMVYFCFKI